jgi:hypothetical protein
MTTCEAYETAIHEGFQDRLSGGDVFTKGPPGRFDRQTCLKRRRAQSAVVGNKCD